MVPWCHLPFKLSSRYFISPNFSRWITIWDESSMKNTREYKVIPDWRKGNNRTKVFFIGTVPIKLFFWKKLLSINIGLTVPIFIYGRNLFLELVVKVKTTPVLCVTYIYIYILYNYHWYFNFLAITDPWSASFNFSFRMTVDWLKV